jgi:demethylmenaquinone methyltransferase/2-methoxy-6-polyprenyl-1,4-benzoquinol methylase
VSIDAPSIDKSGRRVRAMFASIAARYDLLNHLLSLNIDRYWRSFTTRVVPPVAGAPILDCCSGTADLALAYDRAGQGQSTIVASDFCPEMLERARKKIARAGVDGRISVVEADTQRLPLPSDLFAIVCVAFGLRNLADTRGGIDEMVRVAQPGGKVAILEFSKPRRGPLAKIYLTFFKRILPRIGQTIAPNSFDAYRYLPATVLEFPDGEEMLALLEERGLTDVVQHPLTGGIATLYVGTKPAALPRAQCGDDAAPLSVCNGERSMSA